MKINDGYIHNDDIPIAKCTSLIADSKELPSLTEDDGVVHISTPHRIDLLFCADDKVVGVECKKPEDFVKSWQGRRLARQVKTLLQECDIAVVAVKGVISSAKPYKPVNWEQLWAEIVGWQIAGVIYIEVPESDKGVLRYIVNLKRMLSSTNPVARSLAGTDKRPPRERRPGWLLRRIPAIGPTVSVRLIEHFGSAGKVFSATDRQLRKAGANKRQIEELRKALND